MLQTTLKDETVSRAYIRQIKVLNEEYELVRVKKHPHFKFAQDLFKARGVPKQTFYKIKNRLQTTGTTLPGKRGPKNPHKRIGMIVEAVIKAREAGFSRFEIHSQMQKRYHKFAPSESTIYNICKEYELNRLRPVQKRSKRMIIKEKAGEFFSHYKCDSSLSDCSYKVAQMD